jgi:hypothetical protein
MARNAPRSIFGVHGATAYNRTTGVPYGEFQIVKSSSVSLQAELIEQMGGSAKYSWAAEEGAITAELSLNVGELPDFAFELFLGKAPTAGSAETSGNISTAANLNGSTVINGTNGIGSVFLLTGSAANLKFGKYTIKALSSNTFNVYYRSGIDLGRGTNGSHLTDDLCVASALSVASAAATLPAFGLEFAKAGTPAFTTGDTAEFEVRPVNTGYSTARIGGVVDQSFPEFGCLVYAQRRGNQEQLELDLFRCKGAGMPMPFEMGQFAGYELKAKILYDSTKDGIFDMRHVKPS